MAQTLKPITTSRFLVEIDGVQIKYVKSVGEVSIEGKVAGADKELMSGSKGVALRQATSAGFQDNPNVTIEIYLKEAEKEFYEWFQGTMLTSYSSAGAGKGKWSENRKNGTITAYDPDDNVTLQWNLENIWIKGYTAPNFDVEGGDLAVESFEIVCENIYRSK